MIPASESPIRPRTALHVAAAFVLVATLGATAFTFRELHDASRWSNTYGNLMSVALARSCRDVDATCRLWRSTSPGGGPSIAEQARVTLHRDDRFLGAYAFTLAFWSAIGLMYARASQRLVIAAFAAAVAAGAFDYFENTGLRALLATDCTPRLLARTRVCAQTKFILVAGVSLTILLAWGVVLRAWAARRREQASESAPAREAARSENAKKSPQPLVERVIDLIKSLFTTAKTGSSKRDFAWLMQQETAGLCGEGKSGDHPTPAEHGPSAGRWVALRNADLVGVALSGGGIRSATFNLGFLQGLDRLGLLGLVHYLSTVSGGGYIGSFWSAWLARKDPPRIFPAEPGSSAFTPPAEPDEIRHLRDFSRFLSPRVGFFEAEMWQGIVAVLAGLLPAVAAALSVLGVFVVGWLVLTFFLACNRTAAGGFVAAALTVFAVWYYELAWEAEANLTRDDRKTSRRLYWPPAAAAVVLVTVAQSILPALYDWYGGGRWRRFEGGWTSAWSEQTQSAYDAWWRLVGIDRDASVWFFSPRLFDLALVWFAVGLMLVLARGAAWTIFGKRHRRMAIAAYDRVIMRLLGPGVLWVVVATLWHGSVNFPNATRRLVAATVASGGGFALLRNWIGIVMRPRPQGGPLDAVKRSLPQILAYVTIALAFVAVGNVLVDRCGPSWLAWYAAVCAMAFAVATVLLRDPAEFGLHGFYRNRICRAYPGASNPARQAFEGNAQTDVRPGDDVPLSQLTARPLHLVCCTANDLGGDTLPTLGRGGTSAVLSRYGISVDGNATAADVTLGSAVTASAAAFNSCMGSVSMALGPAVGFLMSALNLRLGLWVPNPAHEFWSNKPVPRRLPGALFFREMFGDTFTGEEAPEIHLSDGGHFENLALYELVRRHCRYIIVCDCGADPDVAFDDFGNASRRIREDFGVDISIDLEPLHRDASGRSRQHVVVGTIDYGDFDQGILLYVKPTLTGDEPPDVLQYHTRNNSFPHEPTTDQFYDEAQWEAYRRLGEHTASVTFDFANQYRPDGETLHAGNGARPTVAATPPADWLFATARDRLYPTPAWLPERVREMTATLVPLEAELHRAKRASILHEIFPEIDVAGAVPGSAVGPEAMPSGDADLANVTTILRAAQVLEQVYWACRLDDLWKHPLNRAWTTTFARWVTAPTFRAWWPLLAPMFGGDFGRFLEDRFGVLRNGVATSAGRVIWADAAHPSCRGLAWEWRQHRSDAPPLDRTRVGFAFEIDLRWPNRGTVPVQAALVLVQVEGSVVTWTSDDFYVPPSLWGAGSAAIPNRFLHALIETLRAGGGATECKVRVQMPADRHDDAARAARVDFLEFYKRHGFRLESEAADQAASSVGTTATLARSLASVA